MGPNRGPSGDTRARWPRRGPPQLPQVGRRRALAARSPGVTSGNGQAGVAKLGLQLRHEVPPRGRARRRACAGNHGGGLAA